MLKAKASMDEFEAATLKSTSISLSHSLALVKGLNSCERELKGLNCWSNCIKEALEVFPESAKSILQIAKKKGKEAPLLQSNQLKNVIARVYQEELGESLSYFLSSDYASALLLEKADSKRAKLLAEMLRAGFDSERELKSAVKTDEQLDELLFLFSIRQEGLIPFALEDDNIEVIRSIKRLIECNIPKTLVCQIKSQLHELCACPDLVRLLKSSHNNRKHFIEVKLQLAGIKNKKKLDKFVSSKKKVKILFNKLAKPIEPISKTISEVKKKLSDKKGKSLFKKIKKGKKSKIKVKKAKKIKTKSHKKKSAAKKHKTKAHKAKGHHGKGSKSHAAHKKHHGHKAHGNHHHHHRHFAHSAHSFHTSHHHGGGHAAHHHHHHEHAHHEHEEDHKSEEGHDKGHQEAHESHKPHETHSHGDHHAGKQHHKHRHSFFSAHRFAEEQKHHQTEAAHHFLHQAHHQAH